MILDYFVGLDHPILNFSLKCWIFSAKTSLTFLHSLSKYRLLYKYHQHQIHIQMIDPVNFKIEIQQFWWLNNFGFSLKSQMMDPRYRVSQPINPSPQVKCNHTTPKTFGNSANKSRSEQNCYNRPRKSKNKFFFSNSINKPKSWLI